MTPFQFFVIVFCLTLIFLTFKKYGVKETMFAEQIGHCPKCKVELTSVDLKLHSCPRCNGPIYKQNILWIERRERS